MDFDKYEECFYCGAWVKKSANGDHFPIPNRLGGDITVPCCITCHNMKDNFNLKNWPAAWVEPIMRDFPKLSRESKLMLAKIVSIFSDIMAEREK